jgi:hypothetical protein
MPHEGHIQTLATLTLRDSKWCDIKYAPLVTIEAIEDNTKVVGSYHLYQTHSALYKTLLPTLPLPPW